MERICTCDFVSDNEKNCHSIEIVWNRKFIFFFSNFKHNEFHISDGIWKCAIFELYSYYYEIFSILEAQAVYFTFHFQTNVISEKSKVTKTRKSFIFPYSTAHRHIAFNWYSYLWNVWALRLCEFFVVYPVPFLFPFRTGNCEIEMNIFI